MHMKITQPLTGIVSLFLVILSPNGYSANSNTDDSKANDPSYLSTGNIYGCVYMPTKVVAPLSFVFKPTYVTGIGIDTTTLQQTTLTVSQPGVSCVAMGKISSKAIMFASETYLLSYSVAGQSYSGSTLVSAVLIGNIASGTCTGHDGWVQLDNGANTEVCYAPARCSGGTLQCIKLNQDMYVIFYPMSSSHNQQVTPPKIKIKVRTSIETTIDNKTKTHSFEQIFPK